MSSSLAIANVLTFANQSEQKQQLQTLVAKICDVTTDDDDNDVGNGGHVAATQRYLDYL